MAFRREAYSLDAGVLGHIEGLTITGASKPVLHYFGGLPYALPPIGTYRFRAPRKLPPYYRYGTPANPGRFSGGSGICPQPKNRNPPDPALFDENCLQLNLWIPAGEPPHGGWPVMFYIHGGYLQWGTPNWSPDALARLLGGTAFQALVVMPAYRLNALGFLAGKELAEEANEAGEPSGNLGFWDQRVALEWVHTNISNFSGDPKKITVGGYSAGGLSAFHQLAHELYHIPERNAIIRRLFMLSNGPGVQPKTLPEHQKQFDEFVERLGIPLHLDATEKLRRLRALPYQDLIRVQGEMSISEFRPLSDGAFVSNDLIHEINSGDFARRMKSRGVALLSGECRDEHTMYRHWRTPANSYKALYKRLCAEYSEATSLALLQHYCGSSQILPSEASSWQELFGRVYADVQVHALQRGFHNALFKGGLEPGRDVFRYRFDRRLQCVNYTVPSDWGVTHSTDVPVWFWGAEFSQGLTDEEKLWLKGWNEGFADFVSGRTVDWGTETTKDMRRWRSDGRTDTWEDDLWQHGLNVWNVVNGDGGKESSSLL